MKGWVIMKKALKKIAVMVTIVATTNIIFAWNLKTKMVVGLMLVGLFLILQDISRQ